MKRSAYIMVEVDTGARYARNRYYTRIRFRVRSSCRSRETGTVVTTLRAESSLAGTMPAVLEALSPSWYQIPAVATIPGCCVGKLTELPPAGSHSIFHREPGAKAQGRGRHQSRGFLRLFFIELKNSAGVSGSPADWSGLADAALKAIAELRAAFAAPLGGNQRITPFERARRNIAAQKISEDFDGGFDVVSDLDIRSGVVADALAEGHPWLPGYRR